MTKKTFQEEKWTGEFGYNYRLRNFSTIKEEDEAYIKRYGVSRTELNKEFLDKLPRAIKILEVGSNIGVQLLFLQKMGFENLYSIEINRETSEISKSITKNINVIQGSALDIPFKDNYFDLTFTCGVLIHIAPANIKEAMKEIHRCSKRYIWGFEHYCPDGYIETIYRGNKNMLWKTDFAKLYFDTFPDLKLAKERKLKYLDNKNIDAMFLLEK